MFKIPIHLPKSALVRLPTRATETGGLPPNRLHSSKQETWLVMFSDAQLQTFLTGPPIETFASLTFQDADQILPYTTLEFQIGHTAAPGADTPWQCGLFTTTGQTAVQAGAQLAAQINLYASTMGAQYPDMRSLHAMAGVVATVPTLIIQMPWGMRGGANYTYAGPGGYGALSRGPDGVDNPLFLALWDKKRAIFPVRYPYRDDYYGDVPIG